MLWLERGGLRDTGHRPEGASGLSFRSCLWGKHTAFLRPPQFLCPNISRNEGSWYPGGPLDGIAG